MKPNPFEKLQIDVGIRNSRNTNNSTQLFKQKVDRKSFSILAWRNSKLQLIEIDPKRLSNAISPLSHSSVKKRAKSVTHYQKYLSPKNTSDHVAPIKRNLKVNKPQSK